MSDSQRPLVVLELATPALLEMVAEAESAGLVTPLPLADLSAIVSRPGVHYLRPLDRMSPSKGMETPTYWRCDVLIDIDGARPARGQLDAFAKEMERSTAAQTAKIAQAVAAALAKAPPITNPIAAGPEDAPIVSLGKRRRRRNLGMAAAVIVFIGWQVYSGRHIFDAPTTPKPKPTIADSATCAALGSLNQQLGAWYAEVGKQTTQSQYEDLFLRDPPIAGDVQHLASANKGTHDGTLRDDANALVTSYPSDPRGLSSAHDWVDDDLSAVADCSELGITATPFPQLPSPITSTTS